MFVDQARILVKGGDGGNSFRPAGSFKRAKAAPNGGESGGPEGCGVIKGAQPEQHREKREHQKQPLERGGNFLAERPEQKRRHQRKGEGAHPQSCRRFEKGKETCAQESRPRSEPEQRSIL